MFKGQEERFINGWVRGTLWKAEMCWEGGSYRELQEAAGGDGVGWALAVGM